MEKILSINGKPLSLGFTMDDTFTNIVPLYGTGTTLGTTVLLPRYGNYRLTCKTESSDSAGKVIINLLDADSPAKLCNPSGVSYSYNDSTSYKQYDWFILASRTRVNAPSLYLSISFEGNLDKVLFELKELS